MDWFHWHNDAHWAERQRERGHQAYTEEGIRSTSLRILLYGVIAAFAAGITIRTKIPLGSGQYFLTDSAADQAMLGNVSFCVSVLFSILTMCVVLQNHRHHSYAQ